MLIGLCSPEGEKDTAGSIPLSPGSMRQRTGQDNKTERKIFAYHDRDPCASWVPGECVQNGCDHPARALVAQGRRPKKGVIINDSRRVVGPKCHKGSRTHAASNDRPLMFLVSISSTTSSLPSEHILRAWLMPLSFSVDPTGVTHAPNITLSHVMKHPPHARFHSPALPMRLRGCVQKEKERRNRHTTAKRELAESTKKAHARVSHVAEKSRG